MIDDRRNFINILSHELTANLHGALLPLKKVLASAEKGEFSKKDLNEALSHIQLIHYIVENSSLQFKLTEDPNVLSGIIGANGILHAIKKMLEIYNGAFTHKNIEFKKNEIEIDETTVLPLEDSHFEQLLYNLLDNAAKYSFSDSSVPIDCFETKDRAQLFINITNTGLRIADNDLKHCAKLYWRGKEAKATVPNGLGLGLFIVSKIVESCKGSFEIRSEGYRTSAIVTLPLLNRR